MGETTTKTAGGGIGFGGLLTILFIALKLTGNIDWSWLWVLSPLWIPFGILVGFLVTVIVCVGILALVTIVRDRRRE